MDDNQSFEVYTLSMRNGSQMTCFPTVIKPWVMSIICFEYFIHTCQSYFIKCVLVCVRLTGCLLLARTAAVAVTLLDVGFVTLIPHQVIQNIRKRLLHFLESFGIWTFLQDTAFLLVHIYTNMNTHPKVKPKIIFSWSNLIKMQYRKKV